MAKKQAKRHKTKVAKKTTKVVKKTTRVVKKSTKPKDAKPPVLPKYLAEPDSDIRRIAYWLTRDCESRSAGDPRRPGLRRRLFDVIAELVVSKDPTDRKAAIRLFARLEENELKQAEQTIEYVRAGLEAYAAETIRQGSTALDDEGATPEALTVVVDRVLRRHRSAGDGGV